MTAFDAVQLGGLVGGLVGVAGAWLAAASYSRRRSTSGLVGLVIGVCGALAGVALLFSGLARSAFG